jgi:hypothetical protein
MSRLFGFGVIIALICAIFYFSQVPPVPSGERVQKYLDEINFEFKNSNSVTDIQKITVVQKYILELAPVLYRKEGHVWEIDELAKMKHGSCYDRSRDIETLLANLGYQTRHIYILQNKFSPTFVNLFIRKLPSHAASEVKINGHWLYVDNLNSNWKAIDAKGDLYSIHEIQQGKLKATSDVTNLLRSPFIIIYGLSSRHGNFYPPYVPFPELNFSEFISGLFNKD